MAQIMRNTTEKTSTITLKLYVDLLRRASHGNLESINALSDLERRASTELLNSGLISDGATEGFGLKIIQKSVLTPEGASALENWSSYLRQESPWTKIGEAILRFLWVIVGALAASLTEIIKAIT